MLKLNRVTPSNLIPIFGILITFIILIVWLFNPAPLEYLNCQCYDFFLKKYHNTERSDVPVIVDIDEESLERCGQWPWPRYKIASMLKVIQGSRPLAIGLDILFSEPDRTSPRMLKTSIKNEMGIDIQFTGLPDQFMDNDQMLADRLQNTPTVMGIYCDFNDISPDTIPGHQHNLLPRLTVQPVHLLYSSDIQTSSNHISGQNNVSHMDNSSVPVPLVKDIFQAKGLITSIRILSESAENTGFINTSPDLDGVLRSTPMLIEHSDTIYPALSLALLQTSLKYPLTALRLGHAGIESLILGNLNIPLDKHGRLWIHFRGYDNSYDRYCAADVLDKKISPDAFKDKIVLIGSSAKMLMDSHSSPFSPDFIGVELHAAVIDTVLSGDFIQKPGWDRAAELLILIGMGFIITLIITKRNAILTIVLTVTMGAGLFFAASLCFWKWRLFISPVFPVATLAINFFILTSIKFLSTEKDKAFLKNAFSKYISKSIVDQIVSSPSTLKLQGEEKELSILFADIRNFTSLSERLSPKQVTQLLQQFFTPMTRIITWNNGTLDKFIGDGIMAFWNAPADIQKHKFWAFKSGVEMLTALGDLNRTFIKTYGFEINIGIGLHAGTVRVGNMGTEDLFNYTIIGDNVNVAARLESLTKFYGVRIIISEVMKPHVPSTHYVQELDLIKIKGRTQPLKIYGLYTGDFLKLSEVHLDRYHEALNFYRNHKFDNAHEIFTEFRQKKFDRELYRIYQNRCAFFMEHPPDDNWDGVFVHQNK